MKSCPCLQRPSAFSLQWRLGDIDCHFDHLAPIVGSFITNTAASEASVIPMWRSYMTGHSLFLEMKTRMQLSEDLDAIAERLGEDGLSKLDCLWTTLFELDIQIMDCQDKKVPFNPRDFLMIDVEGRVRDVYSAAFPKESET